MRNRRTAVLGGSGFIGRYVVKRLAARGDVVPVGCRNAEEAKFLRADGRGRAGGADQSRDRQRGSAACVPRRE